jgi:hypothetical protein
MLYFHPNRVPSFNPLRILDGGKNKKNRTLERLREDKKKDSPSPRRAVDVVYYNILCSLIKSTRCFPQMKRVNSKRQNSKVPPLSELSFFSIEGKAIMPSALTLHSF